MPTKIILWAGQSNAMGYGNRGQLAPVPTWAQTTANGWEGHPTQSSDTNIEYPHPTFANAPCKYAEYYGKPLADQWGSYLGQSLVKADQYHTQDFWEERGSYGPEVSFDRRWREDNPSDNLAYVKVASGGTSIDEWSPPNGSMWMIFISELNKAKARLAVENVDYEFAAFVFGHGESGCSTVYPYFNTPDDYSNKLHTLLSTIRANTRQDLPCVIAGIGSQMFTDAVIGTASNGIDTPANRLAATQHRLEQQQLVGSEPGNVFYSRLNLPTLESGSPAFWYHVKGSGILADGERAYAALTGYVPPPPPNPLKVLFNGIEQQWLVKLNDVAIGIAGDVISITD